MSAVMTGKTMNKRKPTRRDASGSDSTSHPVTFAETGTMATGTPPRSCPTPSRPNTRSKGSRTMSTEDIHASYLHWLEEASAYRLAEIAGCSAPDSKTSLGSELLTEVRDEVVSAWRAGRFDWDT